MHPFYVLTYFLLLALFIAACGKTPSSNKFGPYFWKVEKDNKASYFLGTIHVPITFENLQCSKEIKSHLGNSDYLFVERDTNKAQNLGNSVMDNILSIKESKFYTLNKNSQAFFKERSIPEIFNYAGYAFVLNLMILRDVTEKHLLIAKDCPSLGFPLDILCLQDSAGKMSMGASLDGHIESIARKQDLQIGSLDDEIYDDSHADALTQLFETTPEDIDKGVLNFNKGVTSLFQFINQYIKGELAIEKAGEAAEAEAGESTMVLLKDRNEKWVGKFQPIHRTHKQVFLGAGTRHFIGSFNVLDMLKAEGFSIKRMQSSCQF